MPTLMLRGLDVALVREIKALADARGVGLREMTIRLIVDAIKAERGDTCGR